MKKRNLLQILSFFIFICCALYLAKYFYDGYKADREVVRLRDIAGQTDGESAPEEAYASNGMLEEYYKLYEQNNDVVGWVRIDDTRINYPVMYKNTDNDYYLHRNFEGEYQYSGLPFMDKDCNLTADGSNLIIYAHNMKNGSMFADLIKYAKEDFLAEHKIIHFDTMYERGNYEIISVFKTQIGAENEIKYYNFTIPKSEQNYEDFVSAVKRASIHKIDETAEYGDDLLTLSTCSYNRSNERFVVVAKKVG